MKNDRSRCHRCVGALLLLLSCGILAGHAPNLPLDTDVERLLLRLSVRYGEQQWGGGMQPYSVADLERFLTAIAGTDSSGHGRQLSTTEVLLIKRLQERYGVGYGLFSWVDSAGDRSFKINLGLDGTVHAGYRDSLATGLQGIIRPSLAGNLGNLSFYSGVAVWTEYKSDTLFPFSSYEPYDGVAYNLYGRGTDSSAIRSSDLPRGGVRYDGGAIQLEAAVDYLKTGPARFYPVTMSGTTPPITYVRGLLDLHIVTYSHLAGMLKMQKNRAKYLYMHRLSSTLFGNRLQVGINEVIINGNTTSEPHSDSDRVLPQYQQQDRSWELVYCIPFLPFKFIEHYAGDRDNAAISADVTLYWPQQWRWYGEFFLDDMLAPWKLFSNDWGNKWAATIGGAFFGQLHNRDCTVEAEYSHVEPWVYTHFNGGSHRYSHFDRPLGSPLGPNSQSIVMRCMLQVTDYQEAGIGITHIAKNSVARGGKITDVFQYPDPLDTTRFHDVPTKRFLGPGTLWYLQPTLYYSYNFMGFFSFRAHYALGLLENRGNSELAIEGGFFF